MSQKKSPDIVDSFSKAVLGGTIFAAIVGKTSQWIGFDPVIAVGLVGAFYAHMKPIVSQAHPRTSQIGRIFGAGAVGLTIMASNFYAIVEAEQQRAMQQQKAQAPKATAGQIPIAPAPSSIPR